MGITETICPICGKNYIPSALHQYRESRLQNPRRVCSYTCARASERAYALELQRKKRKVVGQ